jgi:hypothetical protein
VLAGCSGTVNGVVTSKFVKKPLAGATVAIGDISTKTPADGHFTLTRVPTGKATMTVEKYGFESLKLPVEVKKTTGPIDVALQDGVLLGKVTENAVVVQAIKGATVKVGDSAATVAADGTFQALGVPIGLRTVEVVAQNHEPFTTTVNVASGDNDLAVALSLKGSRWISPSPLRMSSAARSPRPMA